MKRKHALVLSALALFGLVGCDVSSSSTSSTPASSTPTSSTPTSETSTSGESTSAESSTSSSSAPTIKKVTISDLTSYTPEWVDFASGLLEHEFTCNAAGNIELLPGENLTAGFQDYHAEHIFVTIGNKHYHPELVNGKMMVSFVVPEDNFDVEVVYSVQQHIKEDGFTLKLDGTNDNVRLLGVFADEKYDYFDCYLLAKEGYVIDNIYAKIGQDEEVDIAALQGCSFSTGNGYIGLYNLTIRPNMEDVKGDVVLRVKGTQHDTYKVSYTGLSAEQLSDDSSFVKSCIEGTFYYGSISINNTYYLSSITPSVTIPDFNYYEYGNTISFSFTMPNSDVELNISVKEKVAVSAKANDHIIEAVVYDAPDIYYGVETSIAQPGKSVYVFAKAEEGYKPYQATLGNQTFSFTHYGAGYYYSEVTLDSSVNSAVEILVSATAAYTVSAAMANTVQINDGNVFAEGETVTFIVAVPTGKTIDTVTLLDKDDNLIEDITASLDGAYGSFVMPNKEVKISVTFKDVSTEKATIKGYFDEDSFKMSTSNNFDLDFAEGFELNIGEALNFDVTEYDNQNFFVSIKNGESFEVFQATYTEDGEYTFNKTIIVNGDVEIRAGHTQEEVTPTASKASVKGTYDEDQYVVTTNIPGTDLIEGFEAEIGSTLVISVDDSYGEMFYLGIKNGDSVETIPAVEDEEMGGFSVTKSIVVAGDVEVKIGATEASVAFETTPVSSLCNVKVDFIGEEFSISSFTNFDYDFINGFTVPLNTRFNISISEDYGLPFSVGIKNGEEVNLYESDEDEETGEFTFNEMITALGDISIKISYSESDCQF